VPTLAPLAFRGVYPYNDYADNYCGAQIEFSLEDYNLADYPSDVQYQFGVQEPGNNDYDHPDYLLQGNLQQARITTSYIIPDKPGAYHFWVRAYQPSTGFVSERRGQDKDYNYVIYNNPISPGASSILANEPKVVGGAASSVAGEPVSFTLTSVGGVGQPYYFLAAINMLDFGDVHIIKDFSTSGTATWYDPPAGKYYIVEHAADIAGGYSYAFIEYTVSPGSGVATLAAPTISATGNPVPGGTVRFNVSGVDGTGKGPYRYYYEIYRNWDRTTGKSFYNGQIVDMAYVDWAVPAGASGSSYNLRVVVIDAYGSLSESTYDIHIG
jgi:hypothetical protein